MAQPNETPGGRGRHQRVIPIQQVFARRALQRHLAAMPNVPFTGPRP